MTTLDDAHAAMEAAPGNDAARARFYEEFAQSELFLLLTEDPGDDALKPRLFPLEGGTFAMAFDREERLAAFIGAAAPFAGLSGRSLAALIAGRGVGIGLNLGVAPSSFVMPAEGVAWLADFAAAEGEEVAMRAIGFGAPVGLGARDRARIATALGVVLGAVGGLQSARLVGARYADGSAGDLLVLAGVPGDAQEPLRRALVETAALSGAAAPLGVAFSEPGDGLSRAVEGVGFRLDPASTHENRRAEPDR